MLIIQTERHKHRTLSNVKYYCFRLVKMSFLINTGYVINKYDKQCANIAVLYNNAATFCYICAKQKKSPACSICELASRMGCSQLSSKHSPGMFSPSSSSILRSGLTARHCYPTTTHAESRRRTIRSGINLPDFTARVPVMYYLTATSGGPIAHPLPCLPQPIA